MKFCEHMRRYQTYEVECTQCFESRWPYLPEKPRSYVCQRCVSGAGASRRDAGKASASARKARVASKGEAQGHA